MPDTTQHSLLCYASFCTTDEPVHAMRYHWPAARGHGWCSRDHWYVGLVEAGPLELRLPDGSAHTIPVGTGWIVPSDSSHLITPLERSGTVESALLFRRDFIAAAATLLDRPQTPGFPWSAGAPPLAFAFPAGDLERLEHLVNELIMRPPGMHNAMAALALLLHLRDHRTRSPYADLPPWLRAGMIRMRSPTHFAEGLPALARLCERSIDHINRVVRARRGCTATRLLNDLRMECAAARLRLTDERIHTVAEMVGIDDHSHFYRLFKRAYGTTPRRYRLAPRPVMRGERSGLEVQQPAGIEQHQHRPPIV
ncbi:MAG: helix-turn-helix transcriptional regulator [Planctomycetota bacterium]